MNNDIDTKLLRLARQWAKSITSAPENTYGCLLYTSPSPRD